MSRAVPIGLVMSNRTCGAQPRWMTRSHPLPTVCSYVRTVAIRTRYRNSFDEDVTGSRIPELCRDETLVEPWFAPDRQRAEDTVHPCHNPEIRMVSREPISIWMRQESGRRSRPRPYPNAGEKSWMIFRRNSGHAKRRGCRESPRTIRCRLLAGAGKRPQPESGVISSAGRTALEPVPRLRGGDTPKQGSENVFILKESARPRCARACEQQ